MPAGNLIIPNKVKANLPAILAGSAANLRVALVASTWTPDNTDTGNEVWADVSAHEIAAGNGYAAGGVMPTGVSLTQTGGVAKWTFTAASWLAAGGAIPAWRRAVVYYLGVLNGTTNPVLGHFLGDATPADYPATPDGTPLSIQPGASGLIQY